MLTLSASRSPADPLPGVLKMGSSISPDGSVIEVDSRSLLLNGGRWLPVSGEFHYSRYPSAEWRAELLKMRAGGVDIVATYSFWIHHEEEQGVWDWSGRREFRRFVELCRETGLFVIARIGPWAHGECRNGGLPDWVLKTGCKTRSDDPAYLKLVTPFYDQISAQLSGLLWKDGGPVIAAQCENEFGGPAEHLITLKRMAISAGIDTPIYTFTAWAPPSTPIPTGELLPVFGGYAQGFWNRELTPEVDEGVFRFSLDLEAKAAAMGVAQTGASRRTAVADVDRYPYCCAELGGGMSTSYHRRICIGSAAIESGALVKIGSG